MKIATNSGQNGPIIVMQLSLRFFITFEVGFFEQKKITYNHGNDSSRDQAFNVLRDEHNIARLADIIRTC